MLWVGIVLLVALIGVPLLIVQRRQRRSPGTHLPGQRNEYIPNGDPKGQVEMADIFRGAGSS